MLMSGLAGRRHRARGRHRADRLFPQPVPQCSRRPPARAGRRRGVRAGRLRGLRHAPCRAGLSRHQPGKTRGRIRDPAAEDGGVRDQRQYPGRAAYRPEPDACPATGPSASTRPSTRRARRRRRRRDRAARFGAAGLPDQRPRRDPQSAGSRQLRVQAAAAGQPLAVRSVRPWHLADRVASPVTGEETRSQQHDAFAIRYRVL